MRNSQNVRGSLFKYNKDQGLESKTKSQGSDLEEKSLLENDSEGSTTTGGWPLERKVWKVLELPYQYWAFCLLCVPLSAAPAGPFQAVLLKVILWAWKGKKHAQAFNLPECPSLGLCFPPAQESCLAHTGWPLWDFWVWDRKTQQGKRPKSPPGFMFLSPQIPASIWTEG